MLCSTRPIYGLLLAIFFTGCGVAPGDLAQPDAVGDASEVAQWGAALNSNDSCGTASPDTAFDGVFPDATSPFTSGSGYYAGKNGCGKAYFVDVDHYREGNTNKANRVSYKSAAAATTRASCESRRLMVYAFREEWDGIAFVENHSEQGTWANGSCTDPSMWLESYGSTAGAFSELETGKHYHFAISARDEGPEPDVMNPIVLSSKTQPASFVVNVTDSTATEAGGDANFSVKLKRAPTANVTLTYGTSDVTEVQVPNSIGDLTVRKATLTFTPANWDTEQAVALPGMDDQTSDGTQDVWIQFLDSSSADPSFDYSQFNAILPAPFAIRNYDVGTPAILVHTLGDPTEWGDQALLYYRLNKAPSSNVTLALSLSNSSSAFLNNPSLTFTPSNWDTPQQVSLIGLDDDVNEGGNEPSFDVLASATSSDSGFNGKTRPTSMRTYDDDEEFIADSQGAQPFSCSMQGTSARWTYTNHSDQNRTFAKTPNTNFTGLHTLHVTIRSTYFGSFADWQVQRIDSGYRRAMQRIASASNGTLVAYPNTVTIDKFWPRSAWRSCSSDLPTQAANLPQNPCPNNWMRFADWSALGDELRKFANVEAYDVISITWPVDGIGMDGDVYDAPGVGGWAQVDEGHGTWQEGRATNIPYRLGTSGPGWEVYVHEAAHQLQWGLARAGSFQMQNPDHCYAANAQGACTEPGFWVGTFPEFQPGAGHWSGSNLARLRAYYWFQRDKWSLLPQAANHPMGFPNTRATTHDIVTDCGSPTNPSKLRERRVKR